jgi:hypothetical protein
MRLIREAATVLTLALISTGVWFLYDAFTGPNGAVPRTLAGGTLLCCLALALLYSLGAPVEEKRVRHDQGL